MAESKRSVAVYDVQELVDTKIAAQNLWKNYFDFSPGEYGEQINAASNTTSLVVTHASKISIFNFWKDRINPETASQRDENQDVDYIGRLLMILRIE